MHDDQIENVNSSPQDVAPKQATSTTDTAADTVSDAAVAVSIAPDETLIPLDALVALSPPTSVGSSGSSNGAAVSASLSFPQHLLATHELVISQHGVAYLVIDSVPNGYVEPLDSRKVRNLIRMEAQKLGKSLRKRDLDDLIDHLKAHAEMHGRQVFVWNRVAPIDGGVEIDLGDKTHTRIRVTAGNVETIASGSATLFFRPLISQPMVMPAATGDVTLLQHYVNVSAQDFWLLVGWLSHTLATPKSSNAKFPILVVNGDQGSGKSSISLLVLRLIDPSHVGVQIFPGSAKDLAVAAQNSHVLAYDNLRGFKASMADLLCIAATGGAMSTRALYTDADQHVAKLHVALVLNGVHSFISQPDLAQRCLPIRTLTLPESERKSDTELAAGLHEDLPIIFRGLLDLIAKVLNHLPKAEVKYPERMLEFVRWLAAMELAQRVPPGTFQQVYSEALQQAQLDSLMDNVLASAVLTFAARRANPEWSGTPHALLEALEFGLPRGGNYSREWPSNPIALSKRLIALKASLATQGVHITFSRGRERHIAIRYAGVADSAPSISSLDDDHLY